MPLLTVPTLTRRAFALAPLGVTLLRAAAKPMRWALLSDTHIPADPANEYRGFRPAGNLKKIVPEVLASKPEGALICGDLARLEGLAPDYEALKSLLQPVLEKMPVAMALGNHDDRKNFLGAFGAQQQGVQPVSGKHVAIVEAAALRMVLLDSLIQPNSTPGLLGKAQRAWLAGYLQSSSDLPTLLFVHHTLDDSDGALLDVPRLFDIVRPHRKVKAILYGHSHRYHYDTLDGIHLINLPAVGYNFNDREPVGWVDSLLTEKGGQFTLRAFGGHREQDGQTVSLRWRS
ncbi:MAG: metallophosphoesterase [Acidobacteria bacterium]|nr:metallophosphoesterase [Acidobacteriota bacterium]